MSYIFFDESGDLGFDFSKQKTSKYFLVTFLLLEEFEKRKIDKIVKKLFFSLNQKKKKNNGVLHAHKDSDIIRKKFLEQLNKENLRVFCLVVKKSNLGLQLEKGNKMYTEFVLDLLKNIFSNETFSLNDTIEFIASRRETNAFLNAEFVLSIETEMRKNVNFPFSVHIKRPEQEKGLQAVDFFSWALFKKYEHNDERYTQFFSEKIHIFFS